MLHSTRATREEGGESVGAWPVGMQTGQYAPGSMFDGQQGPSGIEAHHLLIQLQLQAETGFLILNGPV